MVVETPPSEKASDGEKKQKPGIPMPKDLNLPRPFSVGISPNITVEKPPEEAALSPVAGDGKNEKIPTPEHTDLERPFKHK